MLARPSRGADSASFHINNQLKKAFFPAGMGLLLIGENGAVLYYTNIILMSVGCPKINSEFEFTIILVAKY